MFSFQLSQVSSPETTLQASQQQPGSIKKRSRFSPEEDLTLRHLVEKYGQNWDFIASQLKGRNKRQVKERWNSYLSPSLVVAPFSPDEDKLLEDKINEIGTKWVVLLKYFPNRTDVALKNRWNMIKRQRSNGGKHQNRKKLTPQSSGPAPIFNINQHFVLSSPEQTSVEVSSPEASNEFSFFFDEAEAAHEWM